MTNEQILKQAISKAVKNRWNSKNEYDADIDFADYHNTPEIIIFSHEFAKAFWKKDKREWYEVGWQYHLQEMVLEEEPLKYIEKFL